MAVRVKLDLRGLEQQAKSPEMERAIRAAAERVADAVRSQGLMVEGVPGDISLPVDVNVATTQGMRVNRVKAWVNIDHPSGQAVQAKHGALTKAAAQAGLDVKTK